MDNCHICDKPLEVWESDLETPYHYTESGLSHVWLAGVTVYSCPSCETASADIPDMDGLHRLIAEDLILTPTPMSGQTFRFLRKETRMRPKEFAERLEVDPKTVLNWENAEALSKQSDLAVRLLVASELWEGDKLQEILAALGKLARYSWEADKEQSAEAEEIADLAEKNTILGINNDHEWKMAA